MGIRGRGSHSLVRVRSSWLGVGVGFGSGFGFGVGADLPLVGDEAEHEAGGALLEQRLLGLVAAPWVG